MEPTNPSLDGSKAANGNGVGPAGRSETIDKSLMDKKKGPEPKFGASSPDGYSGGKGGAAQLKLTGY
jgi:hypothetical protein